MSAQTVYNETSLDDLWRMRQEAKGEEDRATLARRACEEELLRRFREAGAKRLPLSNGKALRLTEGGYNYDKQALIKVGEYALSHAFITEQAWNEIVKWAPWVDTRKIVALASYGVEIANLIEDARTGRRGDGKLEGPKLKEMS